MSAAARWQEPAWFRAAQERRFLTPEERARLARIPKRGWLHVMLPTWLPTDEATHKTCSACGLRGARASAFHRDKSQTDGLVGRCKNCVAARSSASYAADIHERRDEATQKYRDNRVAIARRRTEKRRANRDDANAKCREYRSENPEIARAVWRRWAAKQDPAKQNARKRAWDRAHPVAAKLQIARYRSRLKALRLHTITRADLEARISVFGDACAYCGEPWSHLDHVKPIALGGPHCLANLRPACAACNLRKSKKHPRVWFALLRSEGRR